MPLDKREKEEIRAVVASELQDVLRQELAQWWAESVLAQSVPEAGSGTTVERTTPPQRPEQAGSVPDAGHLVRLAEALARTQAALVEDMQRTMARLQRILAEMETLVERVAASSPSR